MQTIIIEKSRRFHRIRMFLWHRLWRWFLIFICYFYTVYLHVSLHAIFIWKKWVLEWYLKIGKLENLNICYMQNLNQYSLTLDIIIYTVPVSSSCKRASTFLYLYNDTTYGEMHLSILFQKGWPILGSIKYLMKNTNWIYQKT